MRDMARKLDSTLGSNFPFVFVAETASDTACALEFYLDAASPVTPMTRAAELLEGDFPAYAAVLNQNEWFATHTNMSLHEIARWPETGKPVMRVVGNRPPSDAANRRATIHGPLLIEMEHMKLVNVRDDNFTFATTADGGKISIRNQSTEQKVVGIYILDAAGGYSSYVKGRVLAPDEVWHFAPDKTEQLRGGN